MASTVTADEFGIIVSLRKGINIQSDISILNLKPALISGFNGSVRMIQQRNMAEQVFLYIITFGIYGIYWFYVTSDEMLERIKLDGSPGWWTFMLFVPPLGLYSFWKHGEAVEALTEGRYSKVLIFVLWLVFSPAVWGLTQPELNKRASPPLGGIE